MPSVPKPSWPTIWSSRSRGAPAHPAGTGRTARRQEGGADDRQRDAHDAARRLEHQHDGDDADHEVRGRQVAGALHQIGLVPPVVQPATKAAAPNSQPSQRWRSGGYSVKVISSRKPTWTARTTVLDSGANAAVMIWNVEKDDRDDEDRGRQLGQVAFAIRAMDRHGRLPEKNGRGMQLCCFPPAGDGYVLATNLLQQRDSL
jgi:hypothetical protein